MALENEKCECIDRINKSYEKDGMELDFIPITNTVTFKLCRRLLYMPLVYTKNGRKVPWRTASLTPSFCPFCGVRLIGEE